MKKALFLLFAFLFVVYTNAQDQLYKKDNSKLLVKVIEISPEEIKYKLFDNQAGPIYSEIKSNISLIIYQDGTHETFSQTSTSPAPTQIYQNGIPVNQFGMSKSDSMWYYGYSNNISVNFLNFLNNEIGLMYQKEFFKNNFNIQVPVAFGVETPNITESAYFGYNPNGYGNSGYQLNRKRFDVGFGINYYPTLTSEINYYIGPQFRYMQYDGTQYYSYQTQSYTYNTIQKNSTLTRYTMGITNGLIIRTRSRLTVQGFATIGFKNDVINEKEKIKYPGSNNIIEPIRNPIAFYFYCGFNVGFNF